MSLSILPTRAALVPSNTKPFSPLGGTGPFTWSVLPGGAGGTVNGSGLYTAPATLNDDPSKNTDIVKVQDSLSAVAQAPVMVGSPLELFCDVIQTEMGLAPGRVYLWDQKIFEPTDSGLWIAVAVMSPKPFANSNFHDTSGNSIQSVNMHVGLSIDVISRSISAVRRKEEVILALNSDYSNSQQELNGFRIFPISHAFVNLSEIDGAAIPYRFNISVNVQYQLTKSKAVPFYDTFAPAAVTTDPGET